MDGNSRPCYCSFAYSALACFRMGMSGSLLRQPHFAHQLSKSRIGTQRVEQEIGFQTDQVEIALLISSVEPFESLIFVSQVGIELSNFVSRRVAGLALSLSDFNAFS